MATKIITVCDICGEEIQDSTSRFTPRYELTEKRIIATKTYDICVYCINKLKASTANKGE